MSCFLFLHFKRCHSCGIFILTGLSYAFLFLLTFFPTAVTKHSQFQTSSPPPPPCLLNYVPLCNFTCIRIFPPQPWKRTCGSAFSSRPIVKVGLFPCVAHCAGSAHPWQHHPSQPRHTGHPADPWRGAPEPRRAGPDDLDREVRWRASQATWCSHTGGNQRHLQYEAVSIPTQIPTEAVLKNGLRHESSESSVGRLFNVRIKGHLTKGSS